MQDGLPENDQATFFLEQNPVQESLVLISSLPVGEIKLQIFNIEGRLLSFQTIPFEKQVSLDVSNLSSGIYFLNIKDENGRVEVKKFIKE